MMKFLDAVTTRLEIETTISLRNVNFSMKTFSARATRKNFQLICFEQFFSLTVMSNGHDVWYDFTVIQNILKSGC